MSKREFGRHKVTANELAKLAIMDVLRWSDFEEYEDDPEVMERINKHMSRVMATLDSNGNLNKKIWG